MPQNSVHDSFSLCDGSSSLCDSCCLLDMCNCVCMPGDCMCAASERSLNKDGRWGQGCDQGWERGGVRDGRGVWPRGGDNIFPYSTRTLSLSPIIQS